MEKSSTISASATSVKHHNQRRNTMMYFSLALSIIVATATLCASYLFHEAGLLYVVGFGVSMFGFGFLLGEQSGQNE